MQAAQGHILVVDDNIINRKLLARALHQQGYSATTLADGEQALALLRTEHMPPTDVVLLDVLMPQLDGYQVLQQIKSDPALRDIPVIMISALDELDSVVRCIEMGAEDYLPKPYNPVLLRARLGAALEKKRLRDQEREYLRNVEQLTISAAAVETATFEPTSLDRVAERTDALGRLARVFQRMAREVHGREQRLKQQLEQLRLDLEEREQAEAETVAIYLPMDRRHALANGTVLPEHVHGAALFADISGFTRLTVALAEELGLQRGVEELIRQLNRVYGALIDTIHQYGGSVISFSGDAVTCWFDADDGLRATACALAMQTAMAQFTTITTPTGTPIALAIKVTVAVGPARRCLVGDPQLHQIEVLAGRTLEQLALAERLAQAHEVLVTASVVELAGMRLPVVEWRTDGATGQRFAVVAELREVVFPLPWPVLPSDSVVEADARQWLLPAVYERVRDGKSAFLAELRAAAALFLRFEGIDYDGDAEATAKLDRWIRWVQAVLVRHDGALLQLTFGDKGSYLYAAFGAPTAHEDDAARAVAAALDLQAPPAELHITVKGIGLAYGQVRAGAYGGSAQRTYGVQGSKTNLAAALMQVAQGGILCDEAIYQAAQARHRFESLPPISTKGQAEPIAVYRPLANMLPSAIVSRVDQLPPTYQLTLKVASVIGRDFTVQLLRAIHPVAVDATQLEEHLRALAEQALLVELQATGDEVGYAFGDTLLHETIYNRLLFAQRRQLHRAIAEWYERTASTTALHYALLARHWERAEDVAKAINYLERAAAHAQQQGAYEEAAQYLQASLVLDKQAAVLSDEYTGNDEVGGSGRRG